ncbi:MAG: methylated-DNA--[protein]-cysteine S-methyltransferase [Bacillota bacterium]|nr:methylated-DNA--[protein]-cysteine S-methyltransferase [Bacillota bacterium]
MQYTKHYNSPLGDLLLTADEKGLTGLWLVGQRPLAPEYEEAYRDTVSDCPALNKTIEWLDIYFEGRDPGFLPPIHLEGTDFRKEVWEILLEIPYGKTATYGGIAKQIAAKRGMARMSAQAVGGAVGHNPISIIVPCHRVVGANGSLTGYTGGLDKKIKLLEIEGVDMSRFHMPDMRY